MNSFEQLLHNNTLLASITAWFVAQSLKVILTLILKKEFDIRRFVGAGGMPSSHSALVVALAISIGEVNGYDSQIFAIAAALALVVMYDAAGVRRAAGKQAAVLNEIIEDLYAHKTIREEKLKELLGHTPIEVIAGALLGFFVAILFF